MPDNLFDAISDNLTEEQLTTLAAGKNLRIERIVSNGQSSPQGFWYDQPDHEWVALLQGEACLEFSDSQAPVRLLPGDHINIRAHRKHRVKSTSQTEPTIWLAVHYS